MQPSTRRCKRPVFSVWTFGIGAFLLLACEGSDNGNAAGVGGSASSSGGTPGAAGNVSTAGSGVTSARGGAPLGSGGSTNGGAGQGASAPGACAREVGACSTPVAKVTEVNVGVAVAGYGREGDTEPVPMAIASLPSGGSRLAWLGTDQRVYVGRLDCDDRLESSPVSFPAIDLQDLYADESGGVVLLTREATNDGTDNCGTGTLCGGSSSPCRTMWMVRFDNSGNVIWETQVTNLGPSLAGYQDGARFVWWYQHHGRLAFDGTNYAAYFGVAINVKNGSCVDIHEGDRMQVVAADGTLLKGHDSFEVGCSHAWQSRILWDERTKHFVMVCATDNNCRIAQPNPYRTIATATCDGSFFGGDLVSASREGYWTAYSQGGRIRLQQFTSDAIGASIDDAGDSAHPHLVTLGPEHMLLAWESGGAMSAQIRSSATGAVVSDPFTISVKDHSFQAFKAYPDGSVAYPAAGANSTSIKIARVMPCE